MYIYICKGVLIPGDPSRRLCWLTTQAAWRGSDPARAILMQQLRAPQSQSDRISMVDATNHVVWASDTRGFTTDTINHLSTHPGIRQSAGDACEIPGRIATSVGLLTFRRRTEPKARPAARLRAHVCVYVPV